MFQTWLEINANNIWFYRSLGRFHHQFLSLQINRTSFQPANVSWNVRKDTTFFYTFLESWYHFPCRSLRFRKLKPHGFLVIIFIVLLPNAQCNWEGGDVVGKWASQVQTRAEWWQNSNAGSQTWRFSAYALQIMRRSFRDGSNRGNWCAYPFASICAYLGFP